jgi:chemotaxis protein CheC
LIKSYTELNDQHIDALREIGNIGAGNAATSLGVLLNENVSIALPRVRIEDVEKVVSFLGGQEEMVVAVLVDFSGDVNGVILFIMSMEDAKGITDIIVGNDVPGLSGLSEMKISAVKEIGNILGSSYLGCISTLTGLRMEISVPYVSIDMAGAILAAPVVQYGAADNKVFLVEERFSTEMRHLNSNVILFTDMEALGTMMNRLGIEI